MPVLDSSQASSDDQPIVDEVEVPEQTTDEVSAEEEQQPEQKFTRAEVEALLSDLEKKMDSRIQSQVAKSENRTSQNIQKRLAALEENRGVLKLSDADYEAAQDAIIAEEQKNAYKPQGGQGKPTQDSVPGMDDTTRLVYSEMQNVFNRHGVTVTPDMPEYKDIEAAWNDPKGSLANTLLVADEAARKVLQRTKSFKETAKARTTSQGKTSTTPAYDPNKPASYYLEQAAQPKK